VCPVGAGNITELVPVEDDGTFRYESKHEPGETFFLLSPTLPLVALRQPALRPGDALEITIPHVPSRAFTIRLGEKIAQQHAFLDIQIGDILLPINVWGQHQRLRGQRSMITRRATLNVGAIAQTGPITVVLGPRPRNHLARPRSDPRRPLPSPRLGTAAGLEPSPALDRTPERRHPAGVARRRPAPPASCDCEGRQ
jgi:hypothetical protein